MTKMYTARVRDDKIRELATSFRESSNHVGLCTTREQSVRAMQDSISAYQPLQERIGLVLRKLDDEEDIDR